jgi:hypothetical protein
MDAAGGLITADNIAFGAAILGFLLITSGNDLGNGLVALAILLYAFTHYFD